MPNDIWDGARDPDTRRKSYDRWVRHSSLSLCCVYVCERPWLCYPNDCECHISYLGFLFSSTATLPLCSSHTHLIQRRRELTRTQTLRCETDKWSEDLFLTCALPGPAVVQFITYLLHWGLEMKPFYTGCERKLFVQEQKWKRVSLMFQTWNSTCVFTQLHLSGAVVILLHLKQF